MFNKTFTYILFLTLKKCSEHSKTVSKCTNYQIDAFKHSALISDQKYTRQNRGRNNSNITGSQQDYLVGKSGSPQIYLVVIWPRFKQYSMTNTKFEQYSQILR